MDLALGQGDGAGADPAVAAERARWERLLAASSLAFAPGLDRKAEERVTARVLARVRAEEEHAGRASRVPVESRRGFWWRVVVVSVAAHVAVFMLLSGVAKDERPTGPEVTPFVVTTVLDPVSSARSERPDDLHAALPDPAYADEPLDAERLLRLEADALADGAGSDIAMPVAPPREGLVSRAFFVRTSDPAKRWLEKRFGTTGSLDAIRKSLDALASRQRADGSFAAGADAGETTALVLLAFLGDGHSSRFGARRPVVEQGVAFLRGRRDPASGALLGGEHVLWALSEDFMLSHGFLTPAEGRERAAEIRTLVARVGAASPAQTASAEARLALAAASRARLAEPRPAVVPAVATVNRWADDEVRVDDALAKGSGILRGDDPVAFRRWATKASVALRRQLDEDGLVRAEGASSEDDRVVATARALLALQVPLR